MKQMVCQCPVCGEKLEVTSLTCPACSLELRGKFELSPFDQLDGDEYALLMTFLQCRGNLKRVQEEMHMNYLSVSKLLDNLLKKLGLSDKEEEAQRETIDPAAWVTDSQSARASEIIKTKLKQAGGTAVVFTVTGKPCKIWAGADGNVFYSDKLPGGTEFRFEIFDCVAEMLRANGGAARKGNGRNFKLGDQDCNDSTVVGYIGRHYFGRRDGESVYDPVFVLAAVMEWAGIATNGRGVLQLTRAYIRRQ